VQLRPTRDEPLRQVHTGSRLVPPPQAALYEKHGHRDMGAFFYSMNLQRIDAEGGGQGEDAAKALAFLAGHHKVRSLAALPCCCHGSSTSSKQGAAGLGWQEHGCGRQVVMSAVLHSRSSSLCSRA
jgi:hypothetical protein